jgi:hypothetical protein
LEKLDLGQSKNHLPGQSMYYVHLNFHDSLSKWPLHVLMILQTVLQAVYQKLFKSMLFCPNSQCFVELCVFIVTKRIVGNYFMKLWCTSSVAAQHSHDARTCVFNGTSLSFMAAAGCHRWMHIVVLCWSKSALGAVGQVICWNIIPLAFVRLMVAWLLNRTFCF